MSFKTLGLSEPIIQAVSDQGYKVPSPIQQKAIPVVLNGQDLMAAAQTGTGKTAGFTLPILDLLAKGPRPSANQARALILTPTRELAVQVAENVSIYGRHLNLSSTAVFGGVKINPQMKRLRKGCDIVVATPGRLLDLYRQNAIKFKQLEILVLDEADRMLDMGFIHDIKKILSFMPKKRQNLMFSATFSHDIRLLAKGLMRNPVEISVGAVNSTASKVKQWVHPVDKKQKPNLLIELIRQQGWDQALVFTKTKHGANRLAKYLENEGITAGAIHGNKSQGARTRTLADFKAGEIRILVATDIAARGLDITQLPQVVNFDLPNVPEDYVHRIGRTGRADASGKALSLVSADEAKQLFDIERVIKQKLERQVVSGFEPSHDVPNSMSSTRSPKKNSTPKGHSAKGSSGKTFQGRSSKANQARGDRNAGGQQKRKRSSQSTHANSPSSRSKTKRRES